MLNLVNSGLIRGLFFFLKETDTQAARIKESWCLQIHSQMVPQKQTAKCIRKRDSKDGKLVKMGGCKWGVSYRSSVDYPCTFSAGLKFFQNKTVNKYTGLFKKRCGLQTQVTWVWTPAHLLCELESKVPCWSLNSLTCILRAITSKSLSTIK